MARYPVTIRQEAVHRVRDRLTHHESETSAIREVADELGVRSPETIRRWMRECEIADLRRATAALLEMSILRATGHS